MGGKLKVVGGGKQTEIYMYNNIYVDGIKNSNAAIRSQCFQWMVSFLHGDKLNVFELFICFVTFFYNQTLIQVILKIVLKQTSKQTFFTVLKNNFILEGFLFLNMVWLYNYV